MILKTLAVGPIMANCYIIGCENTKSAAVIDPGEEADRILKELAKDNLTLKYIINTHGHFDHVGGNYDLKKASGADIVIHPADEAMLADLVRTAAAFGLSAQNSPAPDRTVQEGDTISFGEITLKVLHTPGHSPGGISLHTDNMVFVGDTLFAGSIGRTDLPGGDFQTLISSIKTKLFPLGDDVKVYTGHEQATTIGQEKRANPFLR
ncbi:glyoxylase-like metal-dependent hydrolase (beta-lactamase superfamily II) [Desulfosalsimonas propionicica]|uniref:Glyoxylase-like metal-dependent hydrolase (Beta-lactamase superfamily II) n=1 Tax=Desulfosalsimonas propionicica TaxID=332175 RepID=A0A7W0C6X9_9BACT|nr:MBL fold metallo-hydrolase [Desulfosalsimonas propionicica]MBA2880301.1 glyoxylase-like metal-dependent hydrolase (beta-lactamase superfamily II) [Desulfosalsimonas propionicica]